MAGVHWIIERDVVDAVNISLMTDRLSEEGVPFSVLRIAPFSHEIDGRKPVIAEGAQVFCYGSLGLQDAARQHGWAPGVWSGPQINEDRLIREFGVAYLNHDARVLPFGQVTEADLPEAAFVKPNGDTKAFAGEVVPRERFLAWRDGMIRSGYIEPAALADDVLIAVPKTIGCEWRLFVVDGAVATACCYRQYGRVMPERWVPDPVLAFARECVATYDPLPGYALDICQVEDGGYRVVEINTLNSAGFYACDPAVVVSAVNRRLTGPVSDFQPSPV